MTPNLDIWCGAPIIIEKYSEDARVHAAMRADELLEADDLDGYAVWKRILRAVEELMPHARIGSRSRRLP